MSRAKAGSCENRSVPCSRPSKIRPRHRPGSDLHFLSAFRIENGDPTPVATRCAVSQFARCLLLAAASVLTVATPTATQQPQQQEQQPRPPRFRTETNLVRVDVYVTQDGAPVQDLKAEEFELFEDNTPQKIDSFEHIVV